MNTQPTIDHARSGSKPKHERPLTEDADVLALPRPRSGRRDYHVKDVPGLVVRMSPAGGRYVVRKRAPGQPGKPGRAWKVTIGEVGVMSLPDAKAAARNLLGRIERGNDPTRKSAEGMTLGEAHEWMLSNRHGMRARTRENYEALWKRHLKDKHAGAALENIDAQWVRARMEEVVTGWEDAAKSKPKHGAGGVEANRLRAMLGTMFAEWVALRGGGVNPVRATRKFKCERRRKNKLTVEQARAYRAACETYATGGGRPGKIPDDPYRMRVRRTSADFLILNQFVGLRRSNGLGLRWAWVDLSKGTITVPAGDFKTGNTTNAADFTVPVTGAALAMLKRRHADPERHPVFVFPGRGKESNRPMTEPKAVHRAVLALAKLPKDAVTIHDMRRTLGSAMIANGADISEVREQLGHANVATTSIYLNLTGEQTVRKSLERTAAAFGGAQ